MRDGPQPHRGMKVIRLEGSKDESSALVPGQIYTILDPGVWDAYGNRHRRITIEGDLSYGRYWWSRFRPIETQKEESSIFPLAWKVDKLERFNNEALFGLETHQLSTILIIIECLRGGWLTTTPCHEGTWELHFPNLTETEARDLAYQAGKLSITPTIITPKTYSKQA